MKNRKCLDCNKNIWHDAIRCKSCSGKFRFKNGEQILLNSGKTRFKKGFIPWNKGQKNVQKAWNKGLKGFQSGEKHWTFGKPRNIETRKKLSIASQKTNEKYWGGFSKRLERARIMQTSQYVNWRKTVFERDKYACQKCLKRGGKLHADHIKPWALYPNLRYDLNNGQTLCKTPCHSIKTIEDKKLYLRINQREAMYA